MFNHDLASSVHLTPNAFAVFDCATACLSRLAALGPVDTTNIFGRHTELASIAGEPPSAPALPWHDGTANERGNEV